MRCFLPNKFGWRERLLSMLATVMGVVFGSITSFYAGPGAGVAWIFFIGLGTVVLVVIAGSDRCFFTALFTILFTALMLMSLLYGCFLDHCRLDLNDAVFMMLLVETTIVLPTAFAWVVTKIVRCAKHDA